MPRRPQPDPLEILIPAGMQGSLFRLTRDVPAARLRRWSIVWIDYGASRTLRSRRIPEAFGVGAQPVPRATFAALAGATDAFELVASSLDANEQDALGRLERTLACAIGSLRCGNARYDATSQLWVVHMGIMRPEPVSAPLRASSDAVAIAALILECGGRPPAD